VSEVLERPQLADRDGVADVEVRPGRVEALFDAQRPPGPANPTPELLKDINPLTKLNLKKRFLLIKLTASDPMPH
jgi:hypothetical protein